MISFEQLAPNIVIVHGMDLSLLPAAVWRRALEGMATRLQVHIRARYENENTAQGLRFRRNSLRWTLYKAKKGYSLNRGQMLRRIIGTIKRRTLWSISAVTAAGSAVITFDEEYLYLLRPHARWYARNKVPGGRILTVNRLDIERTGVFVREVDASARAAEIKKLERRPITISTGTKGLPAKIGERRPLTLARTAWRAYSQTAAKLRLYGRI